MICEWENGLKVSGIEADVTTVRPRLKGPSSRPTTRPIASEEMMSVAAVTRHTSAGTLTLAPEAGFPVTAEVASLGEDPYVDQPTRRSLGSPHPAPVPMGERDRARTLQPGV